MAVSLDLAISAIRAGRKQEGRQLLNLLIQQNPNDQMAWLWMSQVVDTNEQRSRCLYHVLSLNPESQLARRGLQMLGVVVSDSRPVKLPAEFQQATVANNGAVRPNESVSEQPPAETPQELPPDAARRPFLIDPETITQELPFVPVKPPLQAVEPVQASPEILSLDVEGEGDMAEPSALEVGESNETAAFDSEAKAVLPADSDVENEASFDASEGAEKDGNIDDGNTVASVDDSAAIPVAAVAVAATLGVSPPAADNEAQTTESTVPEPVAVDGAELDETEAINKVSGADADPVDDTLDDPLSAQDKPKKIRSAGPIILPIVAGAATAVVASHAEPDTQKTGFGNSSNSSVEAPVSPALPEAVSTTPEAEQPRIQESANEVVTAAGAMTETQKMPSPFEQAARPTTKPTQVPAPNWPQPEPTENKKPDSSPTTPQPVAVGNPGQEQAHQNGMVPPSSGQPQLMDPAVLNNIPNETRQSQPILVNYPTPNMGVSPDGQGYWPQTQHVPHNQMMPPQNQTYYQTQMPPQFHSSATMGMPMAPTGHYNRPPSEPVSPIPPGNGAFSGQMLPPGGMSLHSNATMMMPTLSEAEARARMSTGQAIPTANAAAMPLQNGGGWPYPQDFNPAAYEYDHSDEDDGEDNDEINVLAVIIFGTLSITALGGLGMLVLLIMTTSPPVS